MHIEDNRLTIEQVLDIMGDEVGNNYTWFLIDFEAQGRINENLSVDDIFDIVRFKCGYYEVSWDFLKEISRKISVVVYFRLIAAKSKQNFIIEFEKEGSEIDCELDFWIGDGEIWEIEGKDEYTVKRLRETFSSLPRYLH